MEGRSINLASATPGDAEFILSLRLDEQLNRHLSAVDNDVEAQAAWLERYLERERLGQEWYFIIRDKQGEPLGTVRLYDYQGDSFCWGSWIIKPGAPSGVAIESALCVYEYAFGTLNFEQSHFDVRKGNARVNAFHVRFGAKLVGDDDLNNYYVLTRCDYLQTRSKYQKYLA